MSLKSKKNWIFPEEENTGKYLEEILKKREIEDVESFLNPKIGDIPDSTHLADTKSAAEKILKHIEDGNKIVIHGDFDSDGICSVSILWEFLYRDLAAHLDKKIEVVPYIPSRIDQGYGLTESSLNDILEMKGKLVITVDCGVRDKELIQKYKKEKDLDFVITDHHQPPEDILENLDYPLVHQMYPKKEYPNTEICGCAVTFLLIQEIKKQAGMEHEIKTDTKGLDLVALATVTDMMPLTGVNRIFVKYGMEQIKKGTRKGLKSLILKASVQPEDIQSYHLGFVIGPRVNAAGRIGSPMDAVKLFVSNKDEQCKLLADKLNSLNFDRQKLTYDMLDIGREMADENQKLIFIVGSQWHEGIIGLVAGKLLEQFYKPVIVATVNENGEIRGSARSIKGFNVTDALEKCDKYLERYGGHELAAGFSVKEGQIDEFKKKMEKIANEAIGDDMLIPDIKIDIVVDTEAVSFKLVEELDKLEPFGYGNPKPTIVLKKVVVVQKKTMGQENNHMRLTVKGEGLDLLTMIMFNCKDDIEELNENDMLDVMGYPNVNVWNGNESMQFMVKEWRLSPGA